MKKKKRLPHPAAKKLAYSINLIYHYDLIKIIVINIDDIIIFSNYDYTYYIEGGKVSGYFTALR